MYTIKVLCDIIYKKEGDKMDIKYEEMTKQDYKDIKRLITEAWFSDYPFKEKYIK